MHPDPARTEQLTQASTRSLERLGKLQGLSLLWVGEELQMWRVRVGGGEGVGGLLLMEGGVLLEDEEG